MSDDELKFTRRLFLQHSAMASAMGAGLYGIAMKTDALGQIQEPVPLEFHGDDPTPYPYLDAPE